MIIHIMEGVRIQAEGLCYEIEIINEKGTWKGSGFFPTLKMALEHLPDKIILSTSGEYNVKQLLRFLANINETIAKVELKP